jgi:P pilus assembly chaperone PapD
MALLALLCGALLSLAAAGCATATGQTRVVTVEPDNFTTLVLQSNQPVLINFYKDG